MSVLAVQGLSILGGKEAIAKEKIINKVVI